MIEKTALPYRRRSLNREEKPLIEQVGVNLMVTPRRKLNQPNKGKLKNKHKTAPLKPGKVKVRKYPYKLTKEIREFLLKEPVRLIGGL